MSTERRAVNLSLLLEHRVGEVPWLIEMENNRRLDFRIGTTLIEGFGFRLWLLTKGYSIIVTR